MARFVTLEQDCRQIDRFLEGYAGVYFQHVGVFPQEARLKIRALISAILERIARIKLDLNLPQRQIDIAQSLAAYLSEMWVTLHETKTEALRGYGEVPIELGAYLDPLVEEILGLVSDLRDTIESGKNSMNLESQAGK